jgi:hypothetical protein
MGQAEEYPFGPVALAPLKFCNAIKQSALQ